MKLAEAERLGDLQHGFGGEAEHRQEEQGPKVVGLGNC